MIIEYEKDYLEELYKDGKCTTRRSRTRCDHMHRNRYYKPLSIIDYEQKDHSSWGCTERRIGGKRYFAEEILRAIVCTLHATE
jgi:hypothetical protein